MYSPAAKEAGRINKGFAVGSGLTVNVGWGVGSNVEVADGIAVEVDNNGKDTGLGSPFPFRSVLENRWIAARISRWELSESLV